MKTLAQLKKEGHDLIEIINRDFEQTGATIERANLAKLQFLKDCTLFIATDPREDYLKKEAERLRELIHDAEHQYKRKYDLINDAKFKAKFLEAYDYKKHKAQLEVVEYCLS